MVLLCVRNGASAKGTQSMRCGATIKALAWHFGLKRKKETPAQKYILRARINATTRQLRLSDSAFRSCAQKCESMPVYTHNTNEAWTARPRRVASLCHSSACDARGYLETQETSLCKSSPSSPKRQTGNLMWQVSNAHFGTHTRSNYQMAISKLISRAAPLESS